MSHKLAASSLTLLRKISTQACSTMIRLSEILEKVSILMPIATLPPTDFTGPQISDPIRWRHNWPSPRRSPDLSVVDWHLQPNCHRANTPGKLLLYQTVWHLNPCVSSKEEKGGGVSLYSGIAR